jgi:uncharacterized protein YbjT (DUF2867 family)
VAVVLGATGLVGSHLVEILGSYPGVSLVRSPVRRPVERWGSEEKVVAHLVDFDHLDRTPEAFAGSQVFLCLGSTLRKAGSREAFRRVDFQAVRDAAEMACRQGARDAFLVSSVGADPRARGFYLRVKGEAEDAVAALPFTSVHVLRPSVLTGQRSERRPAERASVLLGTILSPLMVGPSRRFRPIAARTVARAMARLAAAPGQGIHVHESEVIATLGA